MNENQPIFLQQSSALSEKGARIIETTDSQVKLLLSIINTAAGLNRFAETEDITNEAVYNFDDHVRDSASATIMAAFSRLQGIINNETRWKIVDEPKEDQYREFSLEEERLQQQVTLEKTKTMIQSLRNGRVLETLAIKKAKAEIRQLEKTVINN